MSKQNKLAIIGIIVAISGIVISVYISLIKEAPSNNQATYGEKSPSIITDSGSVNINYSQNKDDDKDLIREVVENFYNDYIKYLNKEFSAIDDKSGFSQPTPRNPDGSIDLSKIQSAPAYGLEKQALAEYLYSRNEIAHSFAQKIDKIMLEAMRDEEEEGLNYDPILLAQDVPESLEYGEPIAKNQQGEITIYQLWGYDQDVHKRPIKVFLYRTGKSWRITDIIDQREYKDEP